MNNAYGLIHDYYPREKMISIKLDDKLCFFYFPQKYYKIVHKAAAHRSVYIFFYYSEKTKVLKSVEAKEITAIEKITHQSAKGSITLYSQEVIDENIENLLESLDYKMFLDFEFTMPSYTINKHFESELLQIGAVISDKNDVTVNEYSTYINTKQKVSDRTKKFLRITDEELSDKISQKQFYEEYKRLIEIYKPTIFVWGGSDTKVLDAFYSKNKLKPINARYIDLVKLIKQHYSLKEDIGLFNALKIFNGIDATQAHHALTDAAATKEVFDSFKKHILSKSDIDLKEIIKEMKESKMLNKEKEETIEKEDEN